jgi:O-antigen ligase
VALQLLLIVWDRMLRFVKARWLILAFLGVMLVAVMTVGMQFDIEDFLVNTLAFDPISAAARFDIFRYGMREIAGSPVFGIGFNDWTRPFWKGGSFDNFWLLIAMRYGIPALVFLVAAVGYNCLRIASRTGLTDQESSYRTGYLISMAGVAFVLGSVHIWGHAEIFVTTFIGAGSWFYTSPVILQRAEAERRRRMHRPQAPSLRPQDPAGADAVPAPAGFRSARTAGAGGSDRTIPFTTRAPGAAHSR